MVTRRWEEAKPYFESSIGLEPDQVLAYVRLAETYWFADGDLIRSRQTLESSPRSDTLEMAEFLFTQTMFERDLEDALEGPHLAYRLVVVPVLAEEYDAAIDQLEILLAINGFWVPTVALLEIDPFWDPLRDNSRFQAMLEEFR